MMFLHSVDIHFVTVGTAHNDSRSLIHLHLIVSQDWNGDTDRSDDIFSHIFCEPLIIRMDEYSYASRQ